MTLDELLLEWSYRSEKGYPSLDSPSDISLLKKILKELNIPSDTILRNFQEMATNLSKSELEKYKDEPSKDRISILIKKIENDEELTLKDGGTFIVANKEDAINDLKGDIPKFGVELIDKDGTRITTSKLKKTEEFGSGSGAGGGSVDTRIMESAHCYGCAIAYYISTGKITKEDLTRENLEQVISHVDVDASIDEIEEFLERKPLWYESTVKSVNKIYELFPNKKYKFHRGSEQVERIYNAWKYSLERQEKELGQYQSMRDDKWNPSDIWLMTDKVTNFDWPGNLEVLNGELANFYADEDLIGISLKMIGKNTKPTTKVFNDPGIPSNDVYKYEGYKTTPKSSGLAILYNGGSITCRNFDVVKGWSTEIVGKAAQGGKCGHTGVNDILKINKESNTFSIKTFQKSSRFTSPHLV